MHFQKLILYIGCRPAGPKLKFPISACVDYNYIYNQVIVGSLSSGATMATNQVILSLLVILISSISLFLLPHPCQGHDQLETCNFDKIYQLGDSYSDMENLIHESLTGSSTPSLGFPMAKLSSKTPRVTGLMACSSSTI